MLDSHSDELVQISEHLSNYQDLDAVHIVSHGEPGQLSFSNAQLNQDTLPEYVQMVEDWGNSLSAEADLLFYGCDVASGEQGNAFIQQISQITDADVAASVDDTGIDGNWKLEAQVGEIEATSVFSDGINQAYQHNLDNFGFAPITLPDFDVVDFNATNFDFTNVSADNLTIFADAGLDFGGVDASTLDNIDFNEIPLEDLEILDDAGLTLEPLSSQEIADINLNVLSGLDYLPEDINLTEFNSFDESTKFAQFSDLVATNAELFDYKDSDLGFDENITIEQLSEFNASDFRALDYTFTGDEAFDSVYYLEQNPEVAEAGTNPFTHYVESGRDAGNPPNEVFEIYTESNVAAITTSNKSSSKEVNLIDLGDSSSQQLESLEETAALLESEGEDVALALPLVYYFAAGVFAYTAISLEALRQADSFQEAIDNSDYDTYISTGSDYEPLVGPLEGKDVPQGFPSGQEEVSLTTPPFDLGAATQIDPKTFPKGDDFLQDILDGQYEFPDVEEGGSYFLPIKPYYDPNDSFFQGSDPEKYENSEPVLDATSYENARNIGLERIGEIDSTTRKPVPGRLGVGRGKTVGFETTVDGVYKRYRLDYDEQKGPHINIEIGKGTSRKKLAIEFPGTEADVDNILEGLQ